MFCKHQGRKYKRKEKESWKRKRITLKEFVINKRKRKRNKKKKILYLTWEKRKERELKNVYGDTTSFLSNKRKWKDEDRRMKISVLYIYVNIESLVTFANTIRYCENIYFKHRNL